MFWSLKPFLDPLIVSEKIQGTPKLQGNFEISSYHYFPSFYQNLIKIYIQASTNQIMDIDKSFNAFYLGHPVQNQTCLQGE